MGSGKSLRCSVLQLSRLRDVLAVGFVLLVAQLYQTGAMPGRCYGAAYLAGARAAASDGIDPLLTDLCGLFFIEHVVLESVAGAVAILLVLEVGRRWVLPLLVDGGLAAARRWTSR